MDRLRHDIRNMESVSIHITLTQEIIKNRGSSGDGRYIVSTEKIFGNKYSLIMVCMWMKERCYSLPDL